MGYIDQASLQGVGEGAVSDIMQEHGDGEPFGFSLRDDGAFGSQHVNRLLTQVHSSEGVMKTRMERTRINVVRKAHLFNAPESLKKSMLRQIKQDTVRHMDEAIDRVVEDFTCRHTGLIKKAKLAFFSERQKRSSKLWKPTK